MDHTPKNGVYSEDKLVICTDENILIMSCTVFRILKVLEIKSCTVSEFGKHFIFGVDYAPGLN